MLTLVVCAAFLLGTEALHVVKDEPSSQGEIELHMAEDEPSHMVEDEPSDEGEVILRVMEDYPESGPKKRPKFGRVGSRRVDKFHLQSSPFAWNRRESRKRANKEGMQNRLKSAQENREWEESYKKARKKQGPKTYSGRMGNIENWPLSSNNLEEYFSKQTEPLNYKFTFLESDGSLHKWDWMDAPSSEPKNIAEVRLLEGGGQMLVSTKQAKFLGANHPLWIIFRRFTSIFSIVPQNAPRFVVNPRTGDPINGYGVYRRTLGHIFSDLPEPKWTMRQYEDGRWVIHKGWRHGKGATTAYTAKVLGPRPPGNEDSAYGIRDGDEAAVGLIKLQDDYVRVQSTDGGCPLLFLSLTSIMYFPHRSSAIERPFPISAEAPLISKA